MEPRCNDKISFHHRGSNREPSSPQRIAVTTALFQSVGDMNMTMNMRSLRISKDTFVANTKVNLGTYNSKSSGDFEKELYTITTMYLNLAN
jgi:hypothetical protein